MKKDVLIDIESLIRADGNSDTIRENYRGELLDSDKYGNSFIFYKEVNEEGAVTDCRMIIGEKTLTLRKAGASIVTMEFAKDRICSVSYNTMFGAIDFDIETRNISVIGADINRSVRIEYVLKSGDTVMSEHNMKIKIRPV